MCFCLSEWVGALERRAADFAGRPTALAWAVGNLYDVLAIQLDTSSCRHVAFDRFLGGGDETETCVPCDGAVPETDCDNCCRRRGAPPWWGTSLAPDQQAPLIVRRDEWVNGLCETVRAAQKARLVAHGPHASPPSLRRVMADWLRKEGTALPPTWARAPLLARALKHGMLRVHFEELKQVRAAATSSGEDARGRSRWHATVTLDTCSLAVARDAPELAAIALHRSAFDASHVLPGIAAASVAALEAAALEEEAAELEAVDMMEAAHFLAKLSTVEPEAGSVASMLDGAEGDTVEGPRTEEADSSVESESCSEAAQSDGSCPDEEDGNEWAPEDVEDEEDYVAMF